MGGTHSCGQRGAVVGGKEGFNVGYNGDVSVGYTKNDQSLYIGNH